MKAGMLCRTVERHNRLTADNSKSGLLRDGNVLDVVCWDDTVLYLGEVRHEPNEWNNKPSSWHKVLYKEQVGWVESDLTTELRATR